MGNILETAEYLVGESRKIVPLSGKHPVIKQPYEFEPTSANLHYWFGRRMANIGLVLDRILLVDTDSPEAEEWCIDNLGQNAPHVISGNRGFHRLYECPTDITSYKCHNFRDVEGLDVITGPHAFVVYPPSIHPKTNRRYEFVNGPVSLNDLPQFPLEIEQKRKEVQDAVWSVANALLDIDAALSYVMKIDPAIEGQGGDRQTFIAALKCARLAQGDPEKTWMLLCFYNEHRCEPKWNERQLRNKWQRALDSWRKR